MTSFKLLRAVRTDTGFHTTWLTVSELTGLKSCWLFFLEYHAKEGVSDTLSECRWVETSASSRVGGAGPQTYRCSYRTAATPSQSVWLVCESSGGILWPTFELNFHVALWAICWIVGLC